MLEMEAKAENPVSLIHGRETHPLIEAYFEFNHLKQLYRQGWLKRDLPLERCETVAEHTFSTAVLAFFMAEVNFPDLDSGRVIRLALLHDFGEVYAGDLTPGDGVSSREKQRLERQAVTRIFSKLLHGETYLQLWEEYEHQTSPEARFVRQIDRLEMALQATVYEKQGFGSLDGFFDSAMSALSDPQLIEFLHEVEQIRTI